MIRNVWNRPISGTGLETGRRPTTAELLRPGFIEQILRERLPATWRVDASRPGSRLQPDAIISICAPDGESAVIATEVKPGLNPRDIPYVVAQLEHYGPGPKLVFAPFLSPTTQRELIERRLSYADLTGNIWLMVDRPAIFIRDRGEESDPWREERAIRSLKGPAAARVIRALCDFRPPYGVRELAERSGTPVASVSRVLSFLETEALILRGDRGEVVEVDWPDLLRRWTRDYSLTGSNRAYTFLEPRGLSNLLDRVKRLPDSAQIYAVTGSLAAVQIAPFAPPRLATVYVENAARAADTLALRPAESGANVLLVEPFDSVAFDRSWERDGITYAALSQVAADLLTAPGRAPVEGEELVRWMEEHEGVWRS